MKESKKKNLTPDEIKACDRFKQNRLNYGMSQEKWAKELKMSHGLVKKIETHAMKCTEKTNAKVQTYIESHSFRPDTPGLNGMKELEWLQWQVLYDIILSHMNRLPEKDAQNHAVNCSKAFIKMLDIGCSAPAGTQNVYFTYLFQLLYVLSLAAEKATGQINDGEDILNIKEGLETVFTDELIKKFKNSMDFLIAKDGTVSYQNNLFIT